MSKRIAITHLESEILLQILLTHYMLNGNNTQEQELIYCLLEQSAAKKVTERCDRKSVFPCSLCLQSLTAK